MNSESLLRFNEITSWHFNLKLEITEEITGERMDVPLASFLKLGSPIGFLSENIIAYIIRDKYEHINQTKLYDFRNPDTGHLIESKTTMFNGLKLCPSRDQGKNRRVDIDNFNTNALNKDFIIGDTSALSDTGIVRYKYISGAEAVKLGPVVSKKRVRELFAE